MATAQLKGKDQRIAHKLISRKVRGPTRSQNAPQVLVWVYRERCVTLYVY